MAETEPGKKKNRVPFISNDAIARARDLLLPMSQLDNKSVEEKIQGRTHVLELQHGKKNLTYFGTPHLFDSQDPIYNDISATFEKSKPQLVLVEGIRFETQITKEQIREIGRAMSLDDAKEMGEGIYILKLAVDANLEFDSPEPTYIKQIDYLRSIGTDDGFIILHYLCAYMQQYQGEHENRTKEDFLDAIEHHIVELKEAGGWDDDSFAMPLDVFLETFEPDSTKYGALVSPFPGNDEEWGATNEVAVQVAYCRDLHALEQIGQALNTKDRIFVVYGSAHALTLEPALRALMSKK